METSNALEATAVEVEAAAAAFSALADPARLRILSVLAGGSRCVCDIQDRLPLAANLLSYHLRVLREAGLIEGAKRGRWVDYRLSEQAGAVVAGAMAAAGMALTVGAPARPAGADR
jgi:ArsR family transcriptional regulator